MNYFLVRKLQKFFKLSFVEYESKKDRNKTEY